MSPDAVDLADFDGGSENKDEDGSDSEDGYSDGRHRARKTRTMKCPKTAITNHVDDVDTQKYHE